MYIGTRSCLEDRGSVDLVSSKPFFYVYSKVVFAPFNEQNTSVTMTNASWLAEQSRGGKSVAFEQLLSGKYRRNNYHQSWEERVTQRVLPYKDTRKFRNSSSWEAGSCDDFGDVGTA